MFDTEEIINKNNIAVKETERILKNITATIENMDFLSNSIDPLKKSFENLTGQTEKFRL